MRKQKKKSRHSKQTHNRQYKDRLWRIVEQLFISDWDSRKVTDNKKRNILVLNYNNYCVKFSSQVNFTTKIEPFAWTNGPISFRDLFHSPFFHSCKFVIKLLIKSKDPICQSCARYTKRDPLSLFCKSLIPSFYLF